MAEPDSGLHEYIDAEIAIEGLTSATDEKTLTEALAAREGIRNLRLNGKILAVEYEPIFIHKTQIVAAIRAAGFGVGEVESSSASPIMDALNDEADGRE